MGWLRLHDLAFSAAVCSEGNTTGQGSEVSDLTLVNLAKMLWVEVNDMRLRISLQLDPDRWLVLSFEDKAGFAIATQQLEAVA